MIIIIICIQNLIIKQIKKKQNNINNNVGGVSTKIKSNNGNQAINSNDNKKKEIKNITNLYNEILIIHNEEREKKKFPALKTDKKLNKLAQKFADNFQEILENNFIDDNNIYGINYSTFKGNKDYLSEIIKICNNWIEEKASIVGNSQLYKYNSKTKHYTQIIWKGTKNIGFGYSKIDKENSVFVVFYYPAGNILDKFKDNLE